MKQVYEYNSEDGVKIYYTAPPLEIGRLERKWLDCLKTQISRESDVEHNILVNLTWFNADWNTNEPLRKLAQSIGPKNQVRIWFSATIDNLHWIESSIYPIYHYFIENNYKVSHVGYGKDHWHTWFPHWFLSSTNSTTAEDVYLNTNPKYVYLAYNRKPREHRLEIVQKILENKLLDFGWVTFEHGHFPEIDNKTGATDAHLHSSDLRYSRPEDLTSLGDMDTWNNSYSVLVSETGYVDPYQISEKTWKPIYGLRPFMINGHNNLYNVLDRLGFYTPKDLFKNSELDCSQTSIINQIKVLSKKSPTDLYTLWTEQLDMLLYNRKRFIEIANSDMNKILNWSQAKLKPHSVPVAS